VDAREGYLRELNRLLAVAELQAIERFSRPRWPTVIVFGAPRSGHTLLSQVLAATGGFGYVTNFVSKFWDAPYLAARIQRMPGFAESEEAPEFVSEFGKTSGWGAPHEGGNFLRRWIPFSDTHRADVDILDEEKTVVFRREVAALEDVYERPVFLRNLVYGLNLDLIRLVFDDTLFVHCTRDVVYQAQSILLAREDIMGDRSAWWSLRPAEYPVIARLPVCEQAVAQIYWTGKAVETGLEGVGSARRLEVSYEELVATPRSVAERILRRVETLGGPGNGSLDRIPPALTSRNVERLKASDLARVRAVVDDYFGPGEGG
jgi:sulfotransferase family protein